jgi:two-component system CheB/CheR fusion protein
VSVVFARHNIAQDAPFPQLDLVSMRNMLIYFQAPLQQRVLGLCHFALVPGGLLLLGSSERPGVRTGLFAPLDDLHRIYTREPGRITHDRWGTHPFAKATPAAQPAAAADQGARLRDALVRAYAPAGLVVGSGDDVLEVLGDVSPWCRIGPGRPSGHAIPMLLEVLRPASCCPRRGTPASPASPVRWSSATARSG